MFTVILSALNFFARQEGRLVMQPKFVVDELLSFGRGLCDGTTFDYLAGKTSYDMRETLPGFFSTSLKFIMSTALISLVIGIGLGILFAFRRSRLVEGVLDFLHITPDFMLAVLLQILSIAVY
ncbi:MAG TPA: hypothetical protein ENN41_05650 [Sediminispirochaeta sp.]|nr:hypothetical protein [Sediminispirochaeta sp.]